MGEGGATPNVGGCVGAGLVKVGACSDNLFVEYPAAGFAGPFYGAGSLKDEFVDVVAVAGFVFCPLLYSVAGA